jgi:hypothetical protein
MGISEKNARSQAFQDIMHLPVYKPDDSTSGTNTKESRVFKKEMRLEPVPSLQAISIQRKSRPELISQSTAVVPKKNDSFTHGILI